MRKVRTDLEAAGVANAEPQIRQAMSELMAKAVAAVQAGT
jgi:hypothetical protein